MSIEPTWATRELPFLVACYRIAEKGGTQSVGELEKTRSNDYGAMQWAFRRPEAEAPSASVAVMSSMKEPT